MKKEGSRVKKTGSEGEKERWRVEKKGGVKKTGFKGEKKGCPFPTNKKHPLKTLDRSDK